MLPNSRPVTKNITFGSQTPASTRIADSYSDNLINDLFSDVDQILEGDLSSYMNVVTPKTSRQPQITNQAARTVKLPEHFVPKSAAELYYATISADEASDGNNASNTSTQSSSQIAHTELQPSAPPIKPRHGGRPVTSGQLATAGNLKSTIIAPTSPTQSPRKAANDPGIYDAVLGTDRAPVQTLPNFTYTDPMPEVTLTQVSARPPQTIFEPQKRPRSDISQSVSLPFLLVGAAGISAAIVLGLWTLSQSVRGHDWLLSLTKEASAAELLNNSDEDFLNYLQESLEVISARQAEKQQLASVIPVAQQVSTLPKIVPNTNAIAQLGTLPNLPGAAKTPSVIERVFVPVYENKVNEVKVATAPSKPLPNVAVPKNNARSTVPVPAPVAAAAAIPSGTPAVPTVPVPANNSLPAPSTPVAAAPTNAAAAAVRDTTPTSEHVLVGVLNLGSRSAALFDIEGSSQRAYVGDRIGLSSWNLVAVNGQDVVIRRDGEVRSVYIGQRF